MKYMNWSYDQLMSCPNDYIEVIVALAEEQNRQTQR